MALQLAIVPAVSSIATRLGLKKLGQNIMAKLGGKALTDTAVTTTTKGVVEQGAKKGFLGKVKDFLIPETKLGKAVMGASVGYSVLGGSDAEASQTSKQDDDKVSLWGTALKVAGIGGVANAVMGGSFFKGALTTGTLALGAAWAWNDLHSDPSTIKGLAEKVLPPETYQSIFGASNNLKEIANPNAQNTQDIKSVQDKAEADKKEQEQNFKKQSEEYNKQLLEKDNEIASLKEQNATLSAEKKDLANANDNVNMAYAIWGDKNMTNEQKTQAIGEALNQMNETQRAEFFKKIENDYQTALNTAVATNDAKGLGQDDKEIEQSYKDAEKAQEQVSQKADLYNDILGNYGNINKQTQEGFDKAENNFNQAMDNANKNDSTAINKLTDDANQGFRTLGSGDTNLGQNLKTSEQQEATSKETNEVTKTQKPQRM